MSSPNPPTATAADPSVPAIDKLSISEHDLPSPSQPTPPIPTIPTAASDKASAIEFSPTTTTAAPHPGLTPGPDGIFLNAETGKPDGPRVPDPFRFGNRRLDTTDDPFTHNAWDHVEPDSEFYEFMDAQLSLQRSEPVPEHLREKYMGNPARYWDVFYLHNQDNFFKDRKWLFLEFPVLRELTREGVGKKMIVEVGCGAGNTLLPLVRQSENEEVKIVGVDFSPRAVGIVNEKCAELRERNEGKGWAEAKVWDLAGGETIEGVEDGSVDVLILIFVLSALAPEQWTQAISNIKRLLKPGGTVLFRDYARGDLAQVRFRKGRYLDENFYVRGDGTRVYFFEEEQVKRMFGEKGFKVESSGLDRRMLVNRQKKLKMYRCWLQVVLTKEEEEEEEKIEEKIEESGKEVGLADFDDDDYDEEEDEDYVPSSSEEDSEYSTEDEELDWEAERELDSVEEEFEEEEEEHEKLNLVGGGVSTPIPPPAKA